MILDDHQAGRLKLSSGSRYCNDGALYRKVRTAPPPVAAAATPLPTKKSTPAKVLRLPATIERPTPPPVVNADTVPVHVDPSSNNARGGAIEPTVANTHDEVVDPASNNAHAVAGSPVLNSVNVKSGDASLNGGKESRANGEAGAGTAGREGVVVVDLTMDVTEDLDSTVVEAGKRPQGEEEREEEAHVGVGEKRKREHDTRDNDARELDAREHDVSKHDADDDVREVQPETQLADVEEVADKMDVAEGAEVAMLVGQLSNGNAHEDAQALPVADSSAAATGAGELHGMRRASYADDSDD
eukprot:TRINITY_DN36142_c0_g1_i1.p1 TRINITY_DN36142_c0_g1~~TRINITY_DN36142_c0_g1_i1.p1  ORF type:complete len:335 (+),score=60.41 TRINITY_DN36142_c0_g1_i1:108-1007(+)